MEEVKESEMAISDGSKKLGRKKKEGLTERESGSVRVKLPAGISGKAREAISELRARGVSVSPEQLMEGVLEAVPDSYFDEQVLQRTPEEYYIRAAIQIPELREKLARQARKALVRKPSNVDEVSSRRRRKRDSSNGETVESLSDLAVEG